MADYRFFVEGHAIEVLDSLPKSSEAEQKLMQTIEDPDQFSTNDVRAYRDHIRQKGLRFDQPELPKCRTRAAKYRCDGNLLYAKKEYDKAMNKYNESICSAPNDSEELGMAYANRSAIFCEYEDQKIFALANIQLAKKHNYPERLMPKLMAREAKCKQALDKHNTNVNSTMPSGLDVNPFLSDGICARKLPIYNNSLVARRDFKAGDMILQEKPLMVAVAEQRKFGKCNHCMSGHLLHLIPCPNCVSAMFCNEKCLQDGQAVHRFECGIAGELSKLKNGCLGSRMFFHGLKFFDGDINKMMAFCRTVKGTENTFLDLDYSSYDPLKEFEIFLAVKPEENASLDRSIRLHAAILHSMLLNVSSVQALITNREQEDFMLQCCAEYMRKAVAMSIRRSPQSGIVSVLYPMASLCNHSCDPNTLALDYGGQLKLIVMRPIRRGEQIFISYCGRVPGDVKRQQSLAALGFNCICDGCDVQKTQERLAKARRGVAITQEDRVAIQKVAEGYDYYPDKKKSYQPFVQRYASIHPRDDYASMLRCFCADLTMTYLLDMDAVMRSKMAG